MLCYVVDVHCAVYNTITAYGSATVLIPGGRRKVKSYYYYTVPQQRKQENALKAEKVRVKVMQHRDINKVIIYISTTTL